VTAQPVVVVDLVVKDPSEDVFGFAALNPAWSHCVIHGAGDLLLLIKVESVVEMLQLLRAQIWRQWLDKVFDLL
jgi:hypothetical protein